MDQTDDSKTRPDAEFEGLDAEEIFRTFGSRIFGRYEIVRLLGEGAMGAVFLAFDTRLAIPVAIKIPQTPKEGLDSASRARFFQEAQTLARLHHPNLCRIFDAGEWNDRLFLTMGYIDGQPLSRPLLPTTKDVVDCIRLVALAVHEAHRVGIIHRDLKPANILYSASLGPVVMDFGLAFELQSANPQSSLPGSVVGTPAFMPPEQARGERAALGPASDVYGLGAILYWLLCDRYPVTASHVRILLDRLQQPCEIPAPSTITGELDLRIDAICAKALAFWPDDRFQDMSTFAAALEELLATPPDRVVASVDPSCIRFDFSLAKRVALQDLRFQDCIYLDIGGESRIGVLDHHQNSGSRATCSAQLVRDHPEWVLEARKPWRKESDPFVVTVHEDPDLDCIASAWLARELLVRGALPAAANALVHYVESVDQGWIGFSLEQPFSVYSAIAQIKHRLAQCDWKDRRDLWTRIMEDGLQVLDFVAEEVSRQGVSWLEVDAFRCPGLFRPSDRREIEADIERYERKLESPAVFARTYRLALPNRMGGRRSVDALFVRDVQNPEDPDRCLFFKNWARSDRKRSTGDGFVALSVFISEHGDRRRRCILSVRPNSDVTLEGLGGQLEQAEQAKRARQEGRDSRRFDPATGELRPNRPGFDHPDPWYDGRGEGFTIVDSPRAGTLLTAEEIENIFLQFGQHQKE